MADVAIIQQTEKEHFCVNCKIMHPMCTKCTATCTLCVGIKTHQFRDTKLCNNYLNWINTKKLNGNFKEFKKLGNNVTLSAASHDLNDL